MLARSSPYAFISTRIARYNVAEGAQGQSGVNSQRVDLSSVPVAYLVGPEETNNDSTNYWMFSEAGLRRILFRAGWNVLDYMTVGNTTAPPTRLAQLAMSALFALYKLVIFSFCGTRRLSLSERISIWSSRPQMEAEDMKNIFRLLGFSLSYLCRILYIFFFTISGTMDFHGTFP